MTERPNTVDFGAPDTFGAHLFRVEEPAEILHPPQVEAPLLPLAVGILSRIKAPFRGGHISQHIGKNFATHLSMKIIF